MTKTNTVEVNTNFQNFQLKIKKKTLKILKWIISWDLDTSMHLSQAARNVLTFYKNELI